MSTRSSHSPICIDMAMIGEVGGAAVSRPGINKRDEATTMPRLAGGRGGHCMQFWTHSIENLASGSLKLLGSKIKSTSKTVIVDKLKQQSILLNILFFIKPLLLFRFFCSPPEPGLALVLDMTAHAAEHTAPPTHDIPRQ